MKISLLPLSRLGFRQNDEVGEVSLGYPLLPAAQPLLPAGSIFTVSGDLALYHINWGLSVWLLGHDGRVSLWSFYYLILMTLFSDCLICPCLWVCVLHILPSYEHTHTLLHCPGHEFHPLCSSLFAVTLSSSLIWCVPLNKLATQVLAFCNLQLLESLRRQGSWTI